MMIGEQLHDFSLRLTRYIFGNLVQQADDPASVACMRGRLSPALFSFFVDFAAKDTASVPTFVFNDDELDQLRRAVREPLDVDGTWQSWQPLHHLSIDCVVEIRQALTHHHAEEWAITSARFARRLERDHVRLRDGIETVAEWIAETHRLLRAMGATAYLPQPEGRFPTPTFPTPLSELSTVVVASTGEVVPASTLPPILGLPQSLSNSSTAADMDPFSARLADIEAKLTTLVEREKIKDWYTTDEAARRLGKAEFTVREWCRNGRIRGEKKGSGRGRYQAWVVSHEELLRYEKEGLLPPSKLR